MGKFNDDEMRVIRSAFSQQILAAAGIQNPALEQAFSTVSREDYLGSPPWLISRYDGYMKVESENPAVLYQDQVFALQTSRNVNNGSPSLHAWGLTKLDVHRGDIVTHIGAGSGYYTALLSHLVGSAGRVTGVEFDAGLACRAREKLSALSNVDVIQADGNQWPMEAVDAIYVNYACDRPAVKWLFSLKTGGRLIFPLGYPERRTDNNHAITASGIFLLVERLANGYRARSLGPSYFVWGEGVSTAPPTSLRESLSRGDADKIRSLRVGPQIGAEWFSDTDWGLSYDDFK